MGTQDKHWTIFLSYCEEDLPFVERLYQKLCDAGITVWYNRKEIRTGQDVPQKIAEGLRGSDFLLVVLSEGALESDWVRTELTPKIFQQIREQQVIILPIVVGNVDSEKLNHYLEKIVVGNVDSEKLNHYLANKQRLKFPTKWATKAFKNAFSQLQNDIEWYLEQRKQTVINNVTNSELKRPEGTDHRIQQEESQIQKSFIEQQSVMSVPVYPMSRNEATLTDSNLSFSSRKPLTPNPSNKKLIANILARHASASFIGSRLFFNNLVSRANLPQYWKQEIADVWKGDANYDSLKLIDWCIAKGGNPEDAKFTTLGSILNVLLEDVVGLDDASIIVAFIYIYQLYLDKHLLENLAVRYQIPLATVGNPPAAGKNNEGRANIGPDITWMGPTNDLELQKCLKPEPPVLDVGFLSCAIQRAASVCRIEIPQKGLQGTGFLIARNLLLTNYHVFEMYDDDNIDENAYNAVIRFGCITSTGGKETKGQTFKFIMPILKKSPADKLDYALLQVEDSIWQAKDIIPVPYDLQIPVEHMGLHILQHPEGETMKLAISSNGITGVYPGKGLVQYVTRASEGSSGSPCFNDDWKLVALHHAERPKYFNTVREGIIFLSIYNEIERYLPQP